MFTLEALPAPPSPLVGQGAARRRRQRRRPGNFGENPADWPTDCSAAGKTRSLGENMLQVCWMMREFKTSPCCLDNPSSHDHRCCPFFHSSRDRRRPISAEGANYLGEPCPSQFDDSRTCSRGDSCNLCHSTAELLYHPDFFRKRLCHQARRCPRGAYCAFAHHRHELLAPHFNEDEEVEPTEEFIVARFKTQWCPVGGPHDWESCVYAHTYRDWRRVPLLGYASHPCPRWSSSVSMGSPGLSYAERCPAGMACPLAHGAKEQLYHPQFYKTSPCSDPDCRRGPLCAFTHGEHDQRQLPLEDSAFRAVKKPIPQAEDLLRRHQPTLFEPPMYHALEDAPRGCGGGVSPSKPRRRKSRSEAREAAGANSKQAPTMVHTGDASRLEHTGDALRMDHTGDASRLDCVGDASRVDLVGPGPVLPIPQTHQQMAQEQPSGTMLGPYPTCQIMGYQWVVSQVQHQQPTGIGGALIGSPIAGIGSSPFGACFLPAGPQPGSVPCLLTMPQSPLGNGGGSPSHSPEDTPVNHQVPEYPNLLEHQDFAASWQQGIAEVSDRRPKVGGFRQPSAPRGWKSSYASNEGGLRTPSSFGSRAQSLAPTRSTSPHSAEGASSTLTDSLEQVSLDDVAALRDDLPLPAPPSPAARAALRKLQAHAASEHRREAFGREALGRKAMPEPFGGRW